jgi:CRISPR/Cas system-associated exonuclease Cas4 (RecB family)
MYQHEETGLLVSGGVDDIWVNPQEELIVVDYKATSKEGSLTTLADSPWEPQYRRQMGVYQWLLEKNGFAVAAEGYFVYANALQTPDEFADILTFETTVIPCSGDNDWIDETLPAIKSCLESDMFPKAGEDCEYCAYRTACGQKLQRIHAEQKTAKNK